MKSSFNSSLTMAVLSAGMACFLSTAAAQTVVAQVVNVEQVARDVPTQQWVCQSTQDSGGNVGASLLGAGVGGLAGSAVGRGNGRKTAGVVGALIGAYVGHQTGNTPTQTQQCGVVQTTRRETVGMWRALVEVDGFGYEWRTNRPVNPGDLIELDMRQLRQPM